MATYTPLEQVDLPGLCRVYGIEEPTVQPVDGGAANSSFHLLTSSGEFTLTILDNHDLASARRLATHTHAISRLGIPTTEVVPTTDGSLVTTLSERPVILKKWVPGEVHVPLPADLLPKAGRILAQLHSLDTEYPGLADLPVGARRLSDAHMETISSFVDQEFASWLTERLRRVRGVEAMKKKTRTIAHGDLFADNVVVRHDGELSVLDWETVTFDDPVLDLGMAAVGLAEVDGVLVRERLNALLAGYQEVMPLTEEDVTVLPVEIEHAALIIAFHRYYRHNVRFPDPGKSDCHLEMIKFVESVPRAAGTGPLG